MPERERREAVSEVKKGREGDRERERDREGGALVEIKELEA